MLVDSRTKEAKLYMQTGATETAAMTSAEGKVQEKNYEATFPVMYNIYGTPTYVCALKDKAGLVKSVAFISVEDALAAYKDALESDGEDLKFETDTDDVVLNDKIQRISADVQGGATTYYFTLQDNSKFIFKGTSKVSNELPLTNVGDNVVVTYTKTDATTINITKFENNSILGKLSTKTESKKDQKSSDENNDKTIKENNSSKSEDTKQNDSNSTQDKENKNN